MAVRNREEFQQTLQAAIMDPQSKLFIYKVRGVLYNAVCSIADGYIHPSNEKNSSCYMTRQQMKGASVPNVPDVKNVGRLFPNILTGETIFPDICFVCPAAASAIITLNKRLDERSK